MSDEKSKTESVKAAKVEVKKEAVEAKKEAADVKKDAPAVNDAVAETVADPLCDEKHPRVITFQDVCQAAFMIKGGIDVTPCRVSLSFVLGELLV